MKVRTEGRLENLRSFMTNVWDKARGDHPFDESNAVELAKGLTNAVCEAELEWARLKVDLYKIVGPAAAGILGGPMIASGAALWHAAASLVGAVGVALWSKYRRREYDLKHPAAFFMDLKDD